MLRIFFRFVVNVYFVPDVHLFGCILQCDITINPLRSNLNLRNSLCFQMLSIEHQNNYDSWV